MTLHLVYFFILFSLNTFWRVVYTVAMQWRDFMLFCDKHDDENCFLFFDRLMVCKPKKLGNSFILILDICGAKFTPLHWLCFAQLASVKSNTYTQTHTHIRMDTNKYQNRYFSYYSYNIVRLNAPVLFK